MFVTARCRICGARFSYDMRGRPRIYCEPCAADMKRIRRNQATARWRRRKARQLWDVIDNRWVRRGPRPVLEVSDIVAIIRSLARGVPAQLLADRYNVSARTVYRYSALGTPVLLQVGMFTAWFAPKKQGPPIQITEWARKVPGAEPVPSATPTASVSPVPPTTPTSTATDGSSSKTRPGPKLNGAVGPVVYGGPDTRRPSASGK